MLYEVITPWTVLIVVGATIISTVSGVVLGTLSVITSYSIHYTKLYESNSTCEREKPEIHTKNQKKDQAEQK